MLQRTHHAVARANKALAAAEVCAAKAAVREEELVAQMHGLWGAAAKERMGVDPMEEQTAAGIYSPVVGRDMGQDMWVPPGAPTPGADEEGNMLDDLDGRVGQDVGDGLEEAEEEDEDDEDEGMDQARGGGGGDKGGGKGKSDIKARNERGRSGKVTATIIKGAAGGN